MSDYELKTTAGHMIKVKPARGTCIVFFQQEPEIPAHATTRSIEQKVPFVLFVGASIEPGIRTGEFVLVQNRTSRLQIPYRLLPDRSTKHITLTTGSRVDQYPVYVSHAESVRQFLSRDDARFRFFVLGADTARIDMVNLKVKFPEAQVLVVHGSQEKKKVPSVEKQDVRATDVIEREEGSEDFKGNPVFMARVYLRNLDLDSVEALLIEKDLSPQDIEFIRTFLAIMIRNELKKEDLQKAQYRLRLLDELYRLGAIIVSGGREDFDKELEEGIDPTLSGPLVRLISRLKGRADSKDEELHLWEWEYRLNKLPGAGRS